MGNSEVVRSQAAEKMRQQIDVANNTQVPPERGKPPLIREIPPDDGRELLTDNVGG